MALGTGFWYPVLILVPMGTDFGTNYRFWYQLLRDNYYGTGFQFVVLMGTILVMDLDFGTDRY